MGDYANLIALNGNGIMNKHFPNIQSNKLEKYEIPFFNQWIRMVRNSDLILPSVLEIENGFENEHLNSLISLDIEIGSNKIFEIPFNIIKTVGKIYQNENNICIEIPYWLFFSNEYLIISENIKNSISLVSLVYADVQFRLSTNSNKKNINPKMNIYMQIYFLESEIRRRLGQSSFECIIRNFQKNEFSFLNTNQYNIQNIYLSTFSKIGYGFLIQVNSPLEKIVITIQNHVLLSLENTFLTQIYGKIIPNNFQNKANNYIKYNQKITKMFCNYAQLPDDINTNILSYLISPQLKIKTDYTYWIPLEKDIKMNEESKKIISYLNFDKISDINIHLVFKKNKDNQESQKNGEIYSFGFNVLRFNSGMANLYFN